MRVHGGFDEGPAKMRRTGLGEVAAAARLARLLDDRVEPGQAGDLLGASSAAITASSESTCRRACSASRRAAA
jgi:hypothetical protein